MPSNDKDQATQLFSATSGWLLKAEDPAMAGQTFAIDGSMTVGRDDACDITIPDNLVSRQHARVEIVGGALQVEDLGSTNGSFINGRQVSKANAANGDELRFHTTVFRVIGPAGDADKTQLHTAQPDATALVGAATEAVPAIGDSDSGAAAEGWRATPVTDGGTRIISSIRPCLLGLTPPFQGKKYVLNLEGTRVGRSPASDICLAEGSISSQHARFEEKNGSWRVIDEGSSNGTFVNDEQVDSSPVEPGNRVRFGRVDMLFELDDGSDMKDKVQAASQVTRAAGGGLPAWLYAVVTFLIVAAGLGVYLFLGEDKSPPSPAKPATNSSQRLQISKLWGSRHADTGTPATPALADINGDDYLDVITVFANGQLQVLDGLNGGALLSVQTGERAVAAPVTAELTQDGLPDIIVAGQNGRLQAINLSGQAVWQSNAAAGGILHRPALHDLNGDGTPDLLVPSTGKGLLAVDGRNGATLWDSASHIQGKLITVPVVADLDQDGSADIVTLTQQGQLLALSQAGGLLNPLWQFQAPPVMYASPLYLPAADGALIVVATLKDGLVAVDARNGSRRWQALPGKTLFATPLALGAQADALLAVTLDGEVQVINAADGSVRSRINVGSDVQATPALVDLNGDAQPEAVLLDTKGRIQVIDLVKGEIELVGQIPGADSFVASPLLGDIDNDGALDVIAAAENGTVFAYGLNRPSDKGRAIRANFPAHDDTGR